MNDTVGNTFAANQAVSYVDAYAPPQSDTSAVAQAGSPAQAVPTTDSPAPFAAPVAPATPAAPLSSADSTPSATPAESLEEQNIFVMLGVENGTEAQKEAFLDELQQVIWEDFLENDAELLISADDYAQLQKMLEARPTVDLEQQEKIVVFLEKLIPDLEAIMLEKALQLKGDMFKERIAGLREYYAEKPEMLTQLDQVEQLMLQRAWQSAATLLNSVGA